MKTIYWRVKKREVGYFLIEFWSKPDRSNALTTRMVTLDEDKIRRNIEDHTGSRHFLLEAVKGEGLKG